VGQLCGSGWGGGALWGRVLWLGLNQTFERSLGLRVCKNERPFLQTLFLFVFSNWAAIENFYSDPRLNHAGMTLSKLGVFPTEAGSHKIKCERPDRYRHLWRFTPASQTTGFAGVL
jgi:hypothetical protein